MRTGTILRIQTDMGDKMSELDLRWTKASRSMGTGACVELAADHDSVLLRNSRHPDVHIRYTKAEMAAFFDGVVNHEFDQLINSD